MCVCLCARERQRFGVNDRPWYPIAVDGCSAAPVAVVVCGCDFSLERGRLPRRCGLRQGWMIENITPINNALIGNQWEYTRQKNQTGLQWGCKKPIEEAATYKSQLKHCRVKWFKVIACLVELCTHTLSDVLLQQVRGVDDRDYLHVWNATEPSKSTTSCLNWLVGYLIGSLSALILVSGSFWMVMTSSCPLLSSKVIQHHPSYLMKHGSDDRLRKIWLAVAVRGGFLSFLMSTPGTISGDTG